MTTKTEVKEFLDAQWESGENDSINEYWETNGRLSIVQNWMSPEIAIILQKLVGDTYMVERLAKNGSNNT